MVLSKACISDADVLIKLCKAGHLEILEYLFEEVYIPERVHQEVIKQLGKTNPNFNQAIEKQLITIIRFKDLEQGKRQAIESFIISYRDSMDDGELFATALANELDINLILIDDRVAKRIIENCTNIVCIAHWEYICLCIIKNKITKLQGQAIFDAINQIVKHPINTPFSELMKKTTLRFGNLT